MVYGGILVFGGDQFFESLRSSNIMVSLKIPTPTPARDHPLGGHEWSGDLAKTRPWSGQLLIIPGRPQPMGAH